MADAQIRQEASKALAATCGIYCGSCPFYRAERDKDIAFKKELSEFYHCRIEQIRCDGCNSLAGCQTEDIFYPDEGCPIKKCAKTKGHSFCYECAEFPCDELKDIDKRMSNYCRMKLIENLINMREMGINKWLLEQDNLWTCSSCGSKFNTHNRICKYCRGGQK